MGHVVCTQRDHVGRRALVESGHNKLIFLGVLLRHGLRRVVELTEHIDLSLISRESVLLQLYAQVCTKGLSCRQEHTTVLHRVALHEVEVAVGIHLVVVVQTVTAQHLQQQRALHPLVGDIGQIDARRVALILDIEAELRLLHRRGEVVHVLHHQSPVVLRRVVRRVFQGFHIESLRGVCEVAGKLSHLIGLSANGVLIRHCQHLIGLQACLQRNIAQRLVHGVLRRV